MNKLIKLTIAIMSLIYLTGANINYNEAMAAAIAPAKPAPAKQAAPTISYMLVSPVDVVSTPNEFLKKDITFNAEFVAYTSLGLDYKPAFKDSGKYIGILIRRDDVKDHVIPLSEMKIFLSRDVAEKHIDLEAGDKVKISGNVFSNALGDPWVDVKVFEVITKKDNKQVKK